MLKSDFRYIIKKIIIGIGIFLGISLIRSCKVYALESSLYSSYFYNQVIVSNPSNIYNSCHSVGDSYLYVIDSYEYKIEYKSDGIYVNDFKFASNTSNDFCNRWLIGKWPNSTSVSLYYVYGTSGGVSPNQSFLSGSVLAYSDNFPVSVDHLSANGSSYIRRRVNFSNGVYQNDNTSNVYSCTAGGSSFSGCFLSGYNFIVFGTDANYRLFTGNNIKWIASDFNSPNYVYSVPRYISLGATPILSDDDTILLGYNFQPTYTFFNTEEYKYCYKVGDTPKLCYTDNDYSFQVRGNLSIYFTIESLNGDILDSETFTIFDIGNSYTGDYSIDFDYKDIAPSDTDNSTGLSNIIDRVDIYITYFPKSNKLKYQYQFVNSGGSLDSQNWSQVNNDNSVNEYTYTTHDNGTLYARILDDNNNIVATNTFTVDSIGKLKLFDDNNNVGGIFASIKNSINYSGPIYSLILMPINFINNIYSNASNTCQRYKIGTLLNNDIYFDCVDFSDYIGSDLYNLIDILCASGVIYGISIFIKKKYNQFTSLSDNDNDIM